MQGRARLARALRRESARRVADVEQGQQLGEVVSTSPFQIELESGIMLDDDEFTLTQWVKRYDAQDTIDEGDTVVVLRKRTGGEIHWLVTDVLADKDPT